MARLTDLPIHFMFGIHQFLSMHELAQFASTCKYLTRVMKSEGFWRLVCARLEVHNPVLATDGGRRLSWRDLVMYSKYFQERFDTHRTFRLNARLKVCVRLKEEEEHASTIQAHGETGAMVTQATGPPTVFEFARVFDGRTTNEEVFAECGQTALASVISGINALMFTYGQSGTGKTHTMFGAPGCTFRANDPKNGLVPRMIYGIVDAMHDLRDDVSDFTLTLRCCELYQSRVYDLGNKHARLMKANFATFLERHSIKTENDIVKVLKLIHRRKHTSSTQLNDQSSRGHIIVFLRLKQSNHDGTSKVASLATLVDLAGNEKLKRSGSIGVQKQEAIFINQSLSALGRTLRSVGKRDRKFYVPFRDSILTEMLKDSFEEESYKAMIVTASTAMENQRESITCMRFAQEASLMQRTFEIAATPVDDITQQLFRLELALARAIKALHNIRQEQLEQMCITGDWGRKNLSGWSVDQYDLVKRYTMQLDELRDRQRPATV